ncbi:MAG: MarR family winged helix-turn-helix transcriptional regulator [Beijerinckiaceae bacterium]
MESQRPSTIYLLHQTSQGLRSRLEQALRPLGVTGLQYTILGLLDRHAGLSSADLSRRFFVTPQTMNQVIAGMLKRGLISREASETNRRVLRMALTPEGRDLLARSERIADVIEADALAQVPGGDLAQMRQHLRLLLRQLRLAGGDDNVVVEPLHNAGLGASARKPRPATFSEKRSP